MIIPGKEKTKTMKDRDGREEQNISLSPTLDIQKMTFKVKNHSSPEKKGKKYYTLTHLKYNMYPYVIHKHSYSHMYILLFYFTLLMILVIIYSRKALFISS